jgi:hypothetical protein
LLFGWSQTLERCSYLKDVTSSFCYIYLKYEIANIHYFVQILFILLPLSEVSLLPRLSNLEKAKDNKYSINFINSFFAALHQSIDWLLGTEN